MLYDVSRIWTVSLLQAANLVEISPQICDFALFLQLDLESGRRFFL